MKALELTIYPPIPPDPYEFGKLMHNEPEVVAWENARYEEDLAKYRKRLTDAELAAMYWGFVQTDMLWPDTGADPDEMDDDAWHVVCKRWHEAEATVLRFASLPHYDEVSP
jgi:hypothetical protein